MRTPNLGTRTSPRKSLTLCRSVTCILRNVNKEKVCIYEGTSLHCANLRISVTAYWHCAHLLLVWTPGCYPKMDRFKLETQQLIQFKFEILCDQSIQLASVFLCWSKLIDTLLFRVRKCTEIGSSVILIEVSMKKYLKPATYAVGTRRLLHTVQ